MFSMRYQVLVYLIAVNSLDDDGYGEPPDLGGEFKNCAHPAVSHF